jgi:glycerol-3-phosphate acyltransferase PlsY
MIHKLMFIGLPVLAYLLGSIPWGLVLTRMFTSVDIRNQGSGNIGATNVSRVAGFSLGILTFSADVLKGAVPAFVAINLVTNYGWQTDAYLALVALASFIGHLYPIYTQFKGGGKGVATAAGSYVMLAPLGCLLALLVFVVLLLLSRRVSAGSLGAALCLPFSVWFSTRSPALTGGAAVIALLILIRHADNIKRLLAGTEPEFKSKQSPR